MNVCRMAYCSERDEPACQFPHNCLLKLDMEQVAATEKWPHDPRCGCGACPTWTVFAAQEKP